MTWDEAIKEDMGEKEEAKAIINNKEPEENDFNVVLKDRKGGIFSFITD